MTDLPTDDPKALEEIKEILRADRVLAHTYLFAHRHPDVTPDFHREMIDDYYGPHKFIVTEAFRGGAKSTIAEEGLCIEALYGEFNNAIVFGENEGRAKERLQAIKYEIEHNEKIVAIWGDMTTEIWGEARIELRNGTYLQALGREQAVRGVKRRQWRPDRMLFDDYEDEDSVKTPELRKKVSDKFWGATIPAGDKHRLKVRFIGTPLDVASLLCDLKRQKGWLSRRYPIQYIDENGVRRAMWAGRWSIEEIDVLKQSLLDAGKSDIWEREYMLNAQPEGTKAFHLRDLKHEPNATRTWEPTYAIYDPARTADKDKSSFTGKVVASIVRSKILVWESSGNIWLPDKMVDDMFETDRKYNPVAVGVETNSLEEFIMQPLRHEQLKRGVLLPLRPLRAPKNKIDFIKGLQNYVKAGEVVLVGEGHEQLCQQFDTFPTGRIDTLNALAYILRIRSGVPVYPAFNYVHVDTDAPKLVPRAPAFLCVNAAQGFTSAVLVQTVNGVMHVLADWVQDKSPGDMLYNVMRDVSMEFQPETMPTLMAPVWHWTDYNMTGLLAAARAVPVAIVKGFDVRKGREEVRSLLEKQARPGIVVHMRASWTLKAMTDGYTFDVEKTGHVTDEPQENVYRTVMNAIECLAGYARQTGPSDNAPRVEHTADGRTFISARAQPRR